MFHVETFQELLKLEDNARSYQFISNMKPLIFVPFENTLEEPYHLLTFCKY